MPGDVFAGLFMLRICCNVRHKSNPRGCTCDYFVGRRGAAIAGKAGAARKFVGDIAAASHHRTCLLYAR